jgi:formylmethanofuran dehydrogenase subunit C
MMPLTFTLRRNPWGRIDAALLTPDKLDGMKRAAIAAIRLQCGRRRVRADELFSISGSDTAAIEIRRSTPQLFRIGSRMRSGTICVRGDAGDNVGECMQGGEIRVQGGAGDWLGACMEGGRIDVSGSIGNGAGAGLPGQLAGMRSGLIRIHGNAGDRLGERMRGGIILVLGNTGHWAAYRLAAGTIIVMGRAGAHIGIGMKRGTIIIGRKPATPMGFRSAGILKMEFLRLLFRQFGGSDDPSLARFRGFGVEAIRMAGDLTAGGKGEILVLLNASMRTSS